MAVQTNEMKSKKGAVIIVLIIVALLAAGIVWYVQASSNTSSSYNTEKLSENLKGIAEQDKQYAHVKILHLKPSSEAEKQYEVLRPLEQHSAEQQEAGKQTTEAGTLKATEMYALAKTNDVGKTQYNASFFVYTLEGKLAAQSTSEIVKSQLDTAIAQAKASKNAAVHVSEAEKVPPITFKTDKHETVNLAASKFEQIISGTDSNGNRGEKKLVSLVAAAKFGTQLLFVNATFDDENEFAAVVSDVQAMADVILLQLSE